MQGKDEEKGRMLNQTVIQESWCRKFRNEKVLKF